MLWSEVSGVAERGRGGRAAAVTAALLVLGTFSLPPAYAAPGDLDPTFGTGGTVTTEYGEGDGARVLVLQPDGKLVVAGSVGAGDSSDFALARYNPNGSLDLTFGTGGTVTTNIGDFDAAFALVLQPDGKLVVAGFTETFGTQDFALARYNPNGSLDPTFGTGGTVTTDIGGADEAHALILQPDGKLVVAGFTETFGTQDFALARYNPDGSLDLTFGTDGTVTTNFGGSSDVAFALVLQPDGKLVAAGTSGGVDGPDFALARYNPDGSLDFTFGIVGGVLTDFGGSSDLAFALVLQPDGKLVAAGWTSADNIRLDFALARYNPNGSLDPTFGTGGTVTTDIDGSDLALALVLQPDGKLIAAGGSEPTDPENFALARYNPNGSLDPTFGTGGTVTTDIGGADEAHALVLQPDGKLVAAGTSGGIGTRNFALARYLGDPPILTVTKTGTGSGTVTSNLPGITCGSDCSVSYAHNTTITLTAIADPGSVFAGYSGNPDCADGTVTLDADTSCTATFNLITTSPDLTGTWRSLTQRCKGEGATQQCRLKGKVQARNLGTRKALTASFLRFYLSADPVWDGGDTLLQQVTISALKAGKAKSKKIKQYLPISQTASGQYVLAVLDATGLIVEQNETNNVLVFGPIP